MLSNAYFLAKFRFGTAKNEPAKNLQNFANFPNLANPGLVVAGDAPGEGCHGAEPRRAVVRDGGRLLEDEVRQRPGRPG